MSNLLILIVASTVIMSIVNALKPAYKKFTGIYTVTISVAISFILWIVASFSLVPFLWLDLNIWLIIMIWLALWTGSNVFYDIWKIVESFGSKLSESAEYTKMKIEWMKK